MRVADYIALSQTLYCGCFFPMMDVDVERAWAQGDSSEIFDFGGLGSGE